MLSLLLGVVEARPRAAGLGLVLVLAFLVLGTDDDSGGQVGDAHRGVRGVDALARGPERQHNGLRGADHPPAHRDRRSLPGRKEPAQEQGQGPAHPAGAPLRRGGGAQARRAGAGTQEPDRLGDSAEKIRTYNFPQNRATDHRINLTLYKLDAVMKGEIDEFVEALRMSAQESALTSEST